MTSSTGIIFFKKCLIGLLRFDKIYTIIILTSAIDVKDAVEFLSHGDFLDGIFIHREIEYSGVIQMMNFKKEILQSVVMGVGLPALLLSGVIMRGNTAEGKDTTAPPAATQTRPTSVSPQTVSIPVINDGQLMQMDLEEYVLGVLLAEMPSNFEPEALRAQAVAARTFTLWCCTKQGNHEQAAVCTEASCCQGYISALRYIQQGGTSAQIEKLRSAVTATAGQVVLYDGELILATYFSCSGGSTESAVAVWGQDYPYLQSVESPGEEGATWYSDQKEFTVEEFEQALGVQLTGVPGTWFGVITYTSGGGVNTADICGTSFRGTELRSKLKLRSTAFTFSASEHGITVHTRGYGHRVGLSQYGADAMALAGHDYKKILAHYYPGTTVETYQVNK
jgi:stage II sporulation protein D